MMAPDLLTRAEAAAVLGVSPEDVTRMVRKGQFEAGTVVRTPGGKHRYAGWYVREMADRDQRAAHAAACTMPRCIAHHPPVYGTWRVDGSTPVVGAA
jgi:hypothetical protein